MLEQKEISEEEIQRLISLRERWYNNPAIQYLITRPLSYNSELKLKREMAMLTKRDCSPPIYLRYAQVYGSNDFQWYAKGVRLNKAIFTNVCYGTAIVNYLPKTTLFLPERKEQEEYKQFDEHFSDYVVGYDIFFDVDNTDLNEAYKDAKKLKNLLEDYKVPFSCRFSGGKGLHFIIPFEYVDWKIKDINLFVKQIKELIYNISGIDEIPSIDNSITDIKRLCKIPYTIAYDKVCLPLTDKQFDNFDVKQMEIENVLKNVELYNRGLLVKDYGLSKEELGKNIRKLFKDYVAYFK
jgi:hypothetical protein